MDVLDQARALRARGILNEIGGGESGRGAKAFVDMAIAIAKATKPEIAIAALHRSDNGLVNKAAAAHTTLDTVWAGADVQALAEGFIASVGEPDLLSALKKHARVIPKAASHVLVASGATGNVIGEGFPKLIRRLDLNLGLHEELFKSVAAVVVSAELLSLGGDAGRALFESELAKAVIRATNAAVLASLSDSGSITSISAGADPLASLRAGLLVAAPSAAYIVTAPTGWVSWLATSEANRGGMGVRGGVLADGIEVLADDAATSMKIISADRLAVFDAGIELRPSGAGTVDLADSPSSPGQLTSLWQCNAIGLIAERHWRVDGSPDIVVVGA